MEKQIFVSCGQESQDEIALGRKIIKVIDEHKGMRGFFAQDVHSPSDLNRAVFDQLKTCDGFFAVMHKRGKITYGKYAPSQRSSVWIQQEIAILCYRMHLQGSHVPIRVYAEKGILLEGVMKTAIVNPLQFEKDEDVLSGLSQWLEGPDFDEHPVVTRRKSLFQSHIETFKPNHWLLLELIAVHSAGPGDSMPQVVIEKDFFDLAKDIPVDGGERRSAFLQTVKFLKRIGLIDSGTTGDRLAIGKQWWDLVLGQLKLNGRIE
jgi:hypothetical protein